MRLRRESADPLYVQLKETLVNEIASGRYPVNERLPSERELSDQYQVSRMTARQALLDLAREGLVYTRVGKGTFVAEPKIDQQLRTVTGFSQDMRERGNQPSSRVLEARVIPATPEVAAALRLVPGADVVLISRVRLSDGSPLALENAHLPLELVPNLLQYNFAHESLYRLLKETYHYKLSHAEQTIEAGLAEPNEADLLDLMPPAAVLRIQRLTLQQDGRPLEYVRSTYRGDRYKFRSHLQTPNAG